MVNLVLNECIYNLAKLYNISSAEYLIFLKCFLVYALFATKYTLLMLNNTRCCCVLLLPYEEVIKVRILSSWLVKRTELMV